MAKTQKRKRAAVEKYKPESKRPKVEGSNGEVGKTVTNIMEMLTAENNKTKECALSSIANLVEEPGAIDQLLNANVVQVLSTVIMGEELTLRRDALGALRNISVDGGHTVCSKMVNSDILVPLLHVLKQYGPGWVPDHLDGINHGLSTDIMLQAVHLLWNLCESSDTAVKLVNKEQLLTLLLPCINPEVYGYNVATVIGNCIYSLSEGNSSAVEFLCRADNSAIFKKIIASGIDSAEHLLLRNIVAGIVYNIWELKGDSGSEALFLEVLSILEKTLTVNMDGLLTAVVGKVEHYKETIQANATCESLQEMEVNTDAAVEGNEDKSILLEEGSLQNISDTVLNADITSMKKVVDAHKLCLEILANLCWSKSDEDAWEDMENEEIEENAVESVDEAMEEETEQCETIRKVIVDKGIVPKVLKTCKIICSYGGLYSKLKSYTVTSQLLKSMELCSETAFLCLVNMISFCPSEVANHSDMVHTIWKALTELVQNDGVKHNSGLLEVVLHTLTALTGIVADTASTLVTSFPVGCIRNVCYGCASEVRCSPEVRASYISLLSAIGRSSCVCNSTNSLLVIGEILVKLLYNEDQLWVLAEGVDATIDIFSDDQCNPSLDKLTLIPLLSNPILPKLRQKMSLEKNTIKDLVPRIKGITTNLEHFIVYKKKLVTKTEFNSQILNESVNFADLP